MSKLKISLQDAYPEVASQWHPTKNGNLMPNEVHKGSGTKVWWLCSIGFDHEWLQRVVERTRMNSGCPFCDGKRVSITNSLVCRFPELAKQWHFEKNVDSPSGVYGGGKTKYWWKCSAGHDHEWQANIQKRAIGQGCPICKNLKVVKSNSLAVTHPHLAIELHPKKNNLLSSDNIIAGSGKKVYWQCVKGHEWNATPKDRSQKGSGCPYCNSGWTLDKIRLFVCSLLPYLDSFDPAELYVLLQQHEGLLEMQGKGKAFIQALKTGRFPKEELEKFIVNQPSLVDEFIRDQVISEGLLNDELGEVSEAVLSNGGGDFPIVETKDVLALLDNTLVSSADAEVVDFFIKSAVAKIWRHAFSNEKEAQLQLEQYQIDGEYSKVVKYQFCEEYNGAKSLEIPVGYAFFEPNLMQRYVAYLVKNRMRIGNWSGTGAGKTLSAILASRVIDAQLTVICCPNNVIKNWEKQIRSVYPDSLIYDKDSILELKNIPLKHQYLILNYEYFQQPGTEAKLKTLVDNLGIDFIVIDEIHCSKQRKSAKASKRKILLSAFLSEAAKKNTKVSVLGMSATPVINELFEGKTLIELVTGVQHDDLNTIPTVANCIALYKKFVCYGVRYVPSYSQQLNQVIENIDCSSLLPEIKQHKSNVKLEAILTKAKIPCILKHLCSKTIVYTHYRDGIESMLQDAIMRNGWKIAFFNGNNKDGLESFINGDVDILIASSCVGTGIDGLQKICNRLIINCLPWTHAEYKQLVGRIYRQGQKKITVDVIIPLTYAVINGERWSWCDSRWKRIEFKKSIADAAIDGTIPMGHLRSPAQAHKDIMQWLERLERGEIFEIERPRVMAPLSNESKPIAMRKIGDITKMNRQINKETSEQTHQRFKNDFALWHTYHEAYREARGTWKIIPYQEAIQWCSARPNLVIGDFGCGEAFLAETLKNIVFSFDHVAINDRVIACDMRQVPLLDASLDAAIFSLSLMGTNFVDYLKEAKRCLKLDGHLWIAEPTARIKDIKIFNDLLVRLGFDVRSLNEKDKFTFIMALKSEREINEIALQLILKHSILE